MTTPTFSRLRLATILAALLVLFAVPAQAAKDKVYKAWLSDLAVSGYDAVAYFTEGKPVEGSDDFTAEYDGALWRFGSAENRDAFTADPARYAPQFGGFCARGIIKGKRVVADPQAWTIVDGKLYIKFNEAVRDDWRENPAENIQKAEEK